MKASSVCDVRAQIRWGFWRPTLISQFLRFLTHVRPSIVSISMSKNTISYFLFCIFTRACDEYNERSNKLDTADVG